MKRRKLEVDIEAILEAMQMHGDPRSHLDLDTGRVEMWVDPDITGVAPAFELGDSRWVEVPQEEPRDAYRAMEGFTQQLGERDVQDQLIVALGGRGAFRRFRDVLSRHPDLRERWQDEQRQGLLQHAVEWLHGLGIEPLFELPPARVPALPAPVRSEPRVTWIDLLLLGAHEGKTELIDGMVHRSFAAKTPERARRVFVDVARELTEHHGIGWRKRFVEGRDEYTVGRCHLSCEGCVVGLAVEVPWAVWNAFAES